MITRLLASRLAKNLAAVLTVSLASSGAASAATQYWKSTSGAWNTAATWGNAAGGPYSSTFTSGSDVVFEANGGTALGITGATTNFASIVANENVTVTASGTLGTGGTVASVTVASGKNLNFAGQALSTAAGTGFIKNGDGIWTTAGGTYAGGFTVNAGTLAVGGVNAMGSGGALTINGGTIRASTTAARDLTGKFAGGITIGGDFALGDATSNGTLTFTNATSLGAVDRNITVNSTVNWNGPVSGTGVGITKLGAGALVLAPAAASTFSGTVNLAAGILTVSPNGLGTAAKVVLNSTGSSTAPTLNASAAAIFTTPYEVGGNTIIGINASGGPMVHDTGGILLLGSAATHTLTINRDFIERGVISDGGNGNALLKTGTNQMRITGDNTFSGGVVFEGTGTGANRNIWVGHNNALGTGKLTISTGAGRLASDSTSPLTLPNAVDIGADFSLGYFSTTLTGVSGASVGSYNNLMVPLSTQSGKLTFSGAGGALRLTGASRSLTIDAETEFSSGLGEGSAGLGLTKTGAALLTLSGANSYTGITTVSQGELLLTGSLAGNAAVSTGAKLSGTGVITGSVTTTGGTLSPGVGSGIGTLSTGAVTLDSASVLTITINDEAPGSLDRIANTGIFSANSASLNVTFADTTFTQATSSADLAAATRYGIVTGSVDSTMFGNATPMSASDMGFLGLSGSQYEATFSGQRFWIEVGSFNLVPLSPVLVPEPSAAAVFALGGVALASRRRRRA